MEVFTTLDTLSEAWTILDELGLSGILLGKAAAFDASLLLNALLKERKLQEFICCITHSSSEEAGALTTTEAVDLLKAFFGDIGSDLLALPGLAVEVGARAIPGPKTKKAT